MRPEPLDGLKEITWQVLWEDRRKWIAYATQLEANCSVPSGDMGRELSEMVLKYSNTSQFELLANYYQMTKKAREVLAAQPYERRHIIGAAYHERVANGDDRRKKQVIMLPGHTTIRKHSRRADDYWKIRFLDMEALAINREKIIVELRKQIEHHEGVK